MKKQLLILPVLFAALNGTSQTFNFTYTGEIDSILIPNCVDSILVDVWGAEGSTTTSGANPGKGAYVKAKMDVTAGQWIYVVVGGQDGYNGGGEGGFGTPTDGIADYAGSGGGASDIRVGGKLIVDRKIVAAGGGGGGRNYVNGTCQPCGVGGAGGDGGISTGSNGVDAIDGGYGANPGGAGKGGTQTAGGDGGLGVEGTPGNPGALGQGGVGIDGEYSVAGGGGGGGYYGGGSGVNADSSPGSGVAGSGGGGGSSYFDPALAGLITGTAGNNSGNGEITITYILSTPILDLTVAVAAITLTAVQTGVSYQWLDCANAYASLAGATNQVYTATANGSYAVELDNNNGCVDTSACFAITQVGITENNAFNIQYYPSPATSIVHVVLGTVSENILVQVYDMNGKIVLESVQTNSTFTVNIESLQSGTYLMKITADNKAVSTIELLKN